MFQSTTSHKKKKDTTGPHYVRSESPRARVDMRIHPALAARLFRQADRAGVSLSRYLKDAALRQLEIDERFDPGLQQQSPPVDPGECGQDAGQRRKRKRR
jgi:hypothetical protein